MASPDKSHRSRPDAKRPRVTATPPGGAPAPLCSAPWCTPVAAAAHDTPACALHLKVIPGARRDDIVGPLGARLKLRIAQPPEGGRANAAVLALLARRLKLPAASLTLHLGPTSPLKTVHIHGLSARVVTDKLGSGTSAAPRRT